MMMAIRILFMVSFIGFVSGWFTHREWLHYKAKGDKIYPYIDALERRLEEHMGDHKSREMR